MDVSIVFVNYKTKDLTINAINSVIEKTEGIEYEIFVEQLKNFLNKYDVVIGISGSGNSKNVVNAIEYANQNGGVTVDLTGYNGGKLKQICKHSVNANIDDMQISEDIHIILCHLIMQLITNNKKSEYIKC